MEASLGLRKLSRTPSLLRQEMLSHWSTAKTVCAGQFGEPAEALQTKHSEGLMACMAYEPPDQQSQPGKHGKRKPK